MRTVAIAAAECTGRALVERALILRCRSDHLPCGVAHVAVEFLLVHDLHHVLHIARARPAEGAGEAGVEHDQHVPACQREQRVVHQRHVEVRRFIAALRVDGQQITVRPLVTVVRHAVASEVEQHTIIGSHARRQVLREQRGDAGLRRVGVDQCGDVVAVFRAEQFTEALRIVGGRAQLGHTIAVVIDADHDGDRVGEWGRRGHRRCIRATGCRCGKRACEENIASGATSR